MNKEEAVTQASVWLDILKTELINWGPKVLAALAILFFGYIAAKALTRVVIKGMRKANVDETLISFLKNIVYMLLMAFVLIASLGKLGVNTTSLAAIFAAAGLAIGLALKDSLGNLASGVLIILNRPFVVDDYVKVSDTEGKIQEISVFATILNTPDNKRVIVPNAAITTNTITNFTANDTRRVDMLFGISYSDDIDKAKAMFATILKEEPKVLDTPAAQIELKELADSSVNFVVRPWAKADDYWDVFYSVSTKVKKACDEQGISIPFPQRDVHVFKDVA